VQHSEYVVSASDGAPIAFQSWTPDSAPRAIVCLVHGLGEHVGRYGYVAEILGAAGYAMLGFDQRGHGKTAGPRGVTPVFHQLMDDVGLLLREAAKRYPRLPQFLYGHSLGGNWVINYALQCKPQVAGVVSTSPALRTAFKPPAAKLFAGKVLYRIAPNMVMPNGLELAAISRDVATVEAYASDPLVHTKMSARLGLDALQQGEWALANAVQWPSLPLLLVHGECDRITSAPATREFAEKAQGDITLKLWPDCYHETHNDPEKVEVLAYIVDWLDRHLPAS
jgi:acylglycerol lipase